MFIEDIKDDFYNILLGTRVLLLVHYDIDAICTCKILRDLFKCDNIAYTLVPVGDISELKTAYDENKEEIKYVILVNCGGTIDIVDILQPEEEVVFFILDAHKPTNVCNVYSDGQVRLVYKDSEENIPNFDDIFRDDEDEEEEITETGRQGLEATVERRRERRAWEERRHTLMFNYTQFSYYGKPSALVCLELAWRLSRGAPALWPAAVAAAAAVETATRDAPKCLLDAEPLHRHIAVSSSASADKDHTAVVIVQKDISLILYRRWSVWESLRLSPATAPALALGAGGGGAGGAGGGGWDGQGGRKLRALATVLGIPLQQARQSYRTMDLALRRSLLTSLEEVAGSMKLGTITRSAFLLQCPHKQDLSAYDMVYIVMGLVDNDKISRATGFQQALSSLAVPPPEAILGAGAANAKAALAAMANVVGGALQAKTIAHAGPFTHFTIQEGTPESSLLRGPFWLGVVNRAMSASLGHSRAVLVLSATRPAGRPAASPADGPSATTILALPPHCLTDTSNLFGAAFENAATRSGATVSLTHFDSNVITLPTAQCPQFLDALTALLS